MNQNMIKKLQQMQKEMKEAQEQLEKSIFYGQAGGQTVEVEFNGAKEMQSININREAFELPDDYDMLEDTIIAAVNDCMKKIDEETQETLGKYTQGMPGMF